MADAFDVFLSYRRGGSSDYKRIAAALRAAGKRVFLDEQTLPGNSWVKRIAEVIQSVPFAIAWIDGPLGPWQEKEVEALIVLVAGAPRATRR